jgi:hypothetical protein
MIGRIGPEYLRGGTEPFVAPKAAKSAAVGVWGTVVLLSYILGE